MNDAATTGDLGESKKYARGLTRRRLLGGAAVGAGGLAIGGLSVAKLSGSADAQSAQRVAFYGAHQAGIATPAQDRLLFASFDVVTRERADVIALLKGWTRAAARLVNGEPVGFARDAASPADDTGEALGLQPARLTLTFGFGPTLFERDGIDRYGLAASRPDSLVDLPAFRGDALDPARSGGDLCVQACGDDPQVLFHAIRNLARIGRGSVVLRWVQEGFGRTSSTSQTQVTPRNLLGFKDGTNNIRSEQSDFAEHVWADPGADPAWMRGGSFLVARRIRVRMETWDRSSLSDQEATLGRHRSTGAPLGATDEFHTVDLAAADSGGAPVIPADAHIAIANQESLGIHLLRRGYNFTDGMDPRTGQLDAGLFFLAYQRDPRVQFIPMQHALAGADALNEYIQHVGSAMFAVPPGVNPGSFVGETLFH